jgi:hypothetical protein
MPLKFELPSFEFNAQFEQLFMQSDQILMFHFDIDIGGDGIKCKFNTKLATILKVATIVYKYIPPKNIFV